MKHILLIGSTSLVGRSLQRILKNNNYQCSVYDRADGFDLFEEKTTEEWQRIILPFDAVVYLAWSGVPSESTSSIHNGINVNLRTIRHICRALAQLKKGHLIFFSSAGAVYGNQKGLLTEQAECSPISHYGQSKLDAEQLILQISQSGSLFQYHCLRISNIYGPRKTVKKGFDLVNHLVNSILNNSLFKLYGDGENTRDFIFVDDVAQAVRKCIEQPKELSNTLNICSGASHSINEICSEIKQQTDMCLNITRLPPRGCDVKHVLLSNKKAVQYLNWNTNFSLKLGIKHTIDAKNN